MMNKNVLLLHHRMHPLKAKKIYSSSDEVINAINKFEKSTHKAKDLRNKTMPSFDIRLNYEAQK